MSNGANLVWRSEVVKQCPIERFTGDCAQRREARLQVGINKRSINYTQTREQLLRGMRWLQRVQQLLC